MEMPQVGTRYRHYKTKNIYEVLALAHHSETLEPLVIYRGEYDSPEFGPNPVWARPAAMFVATVEYEGKTVPRFAPVEI